MRESKQLREAYSLSQQKIADYLFLTQSAYCNYKNGKRNISIEVLASLADFYQTSMDYLAGRTDDPKLLECKKQQAELMG